MIRLLTSCRWLLVCLALVQLCVGCAAPPAAAPPPEPPPSSLQVGATTIVAVAPPAPAASSHPSLFQLSGIPDLFKAVGGGIRGVMTRIRSILGMRFPGLEPKPGLVPITDPANLGENASPAQQSAAEIKAEEDAAPQKIKALRYLATIGCGGCYPSVEDALLAALDDCTEKVRYEAVKALRTTTDSPCNFCHAGACCSEKVREKLDEIANKQDDRGCYKEPSERVRRLARQVLDACGMPSAPSQQSEGPEPLEGGVPTTLETAAEEPPAASESVLIAKDPEEASTDLQQASFVDPAGIPGVPSDQILAMVYGEKIRGEELLPMVAARVFSESAADPGVPSGSFHQRLLQEELERAIDAKLILRHAMPRRLPAPQQHEDWDSVSQVAYQTRPAMSLVEQRELAEAWLDSNLRFNTSIAPADVREYYHQRQATYRIPGQVRWEQIFVPADAVSAKDDGREVIRYLKRRALGRPVLRVPDFDEELVEIQAFPWKDDAVHDRPEVATILAGLEVGEISEAMENESGWYLFRLLERRSPKLIPVAEAQPQIQREILRQRREARRNALLAQLRQEAEIWIGPIQGDGTPSPQ